MMAAKYKARVQTSVIRKQPRYANLESGLWNPISYYGSLTITDSIVSATTSRRISFSPRKYLFPRWNFIAGRAEFFPGEATPGEVFS